MIVTANNYYIDIICMKFNILKILYLSETLLLPLEVLFMPIASLQNVSLTSALEESLIIEPIFKAIVISKLCIDVPKK